MATSSYTVLFESAHRQLQRAHNEKIRTVFKTNKYLSKHRQGHFGIVFIYAVPNDNARLVIKIPIHHADRMMQLLVRKFDSKVQRQHGQHHQIIPGEYLVLSQTEYWQRERNWYIKTSQCLGTPFALYPDGNVAPFEKRLGQLATQLQQKKLPFIVLPYAPYTVQYVWTELQTRINEPQTAYLVEAIIKQLLLQIALLFKAGIAHNDIKPSNMLLFQPPRTLKKLTYVVNANNDVLEIVFKGMEPLLLKLTDYGNASYIGHDLSVLAHIFEHVRQVLFTGFDPPLQNLGLCTMFDMVCHLLLKIPDWRQYPRRV